MHPRSPQSPPHRAGGAQGTEVWQAGCCRPLQGGPKAVPKQAEGRAQQQRGGAADSQMGGTQNVA